MVKNRRKISNIGIKEEREKAKEGDGNIQEEEKNM
jgi:hypothetical protein